MTAPTDGKRREAKGSLFPRPHEYLRIIKRRSLLIMALALAFCAIATTLAFVIPPKFESVATVMVDPRQKRLVDFDSVLSDMRVDATAVDSEVEIIQSHSVLRRVVADLRLDLDEDFLNENSWLRRLGEKFEVKLSKDQSRHDDAVASGAPGEIALTPQQEQDIVERIAGNLTVKRFKVTYIIEIAYRSQSPGRAAAIANAVARAYLAEQVANKAGVNETASTWLDHQNIDLKAKVSAAERKVEAFRSANNLVVSEGHLLGEKELVRMQEQLVLARSATESARANYRQAEQLAAGDASLEALNEVLKSATVARLKDQHAAVSRALADLETRYGPLHPAFVKARAEFNDVRRQLDAEIGRVVANLRNEYEVAASREAATAKRLETLKGDSLSDDEATVKLRELEREASATRTVYESFLKRYQETVQQNLQLPDARIVQIAQPADQAASPKRKLMMIGGAAAGLLIGLLWAVLSEIAWPRTLKPERVEASLRLPHLATVPDINSTRRRRGPVLSGAETRGAAERIRQIALDPHSRFADAIRTLRLGIDDADVTAKVVQLVSALPCEGKTTIAANLALSYAMTGLKTLLIDADLRRANLTGVYLPQAACGLQEMLMSGRPLREAIQREQQSGLFFLPALAHDANPLMVAELLASRRFADGMRELREEFEMIVIDSPPLLPVVDGRVIADHVDEVVFVYNWRTTARPLAERALACLGANADRVIGVVVNGVAEAQLPETMPYPLRKVA